MKQEKPSLQMRQGRRFVYVIKILISTQVGSSPGLRLRLFGDRRVRQSQPASGHGRHFRKGACAKVVRTADPRDTARWLAAERKRQLQSRFRRGSRPTAWHPEKRKKQPTRSLAAEARHVDFERRCWAAWTRRDRDALGRLKVVELKQLCESVGEIASGNKAALVDGLLTPANPALLVAKEARRQEGTERPHEQLRLLVRLRCGPEPLTKERWMAAAEATGIANVPCEKSGPMAYDGWAGVGRRPHAGKPALGRERARLPLQA